MGQVTDKELHFFAGVAVSFGAAIPLLPLWVLVVVAAAASYREMQGIKWDWKDWLNTMAGGLIGFAISFV